MIYEILGGNYERGRNIPDPQAAYSLLGNPDIE